MLAVRNLAVGYGAKEVARIAALDLEAGHAALLLGPSGVGKTTILLTLAGLLPRLSGEIMLDGNDPSAATSQDQFRGTHIGFVFQELNLLGGLSALENVLLAPFACGARQDKARALDLLDRLELSDHAHARIDKLSRGQAQRVALARALMMSPKLVIADEPTSSLDDDAAANVARLLTETAAQFGAALFVATHDSRLKTRIAHHIVLPARASAQATP